MPTWISVNGPYPVGDIYFGDCCSGDREATQEEAEAGELKRQSVIASANASITIDDVIAVLAPEQRAQLSVKKS